MLPVASDEETGHSCKGYAACRQCSDEDGAAKFTQRGLGADAYDEKAGRRGAAAGQPSVASRNAAVMRAAYWSAPESSWATMDASPRVMTVSVVLPQTTS